MTQDGITVPSTGAAQMQHFYNDDGMNIFRMPVGWQYLTNNVVGGDLDATNFGKYDELMQSCLDLGAKVRDFMICFHAQHDPDEAQASCNFGHQCFKSFKKTQLINSLQCVIDVHNYARWNGQVIGQGGPTNDGKLGSHHVPEYHQDTH